MFKDSHDFNLTKSKIPFFLPPCLFHLLKVSFLFKEQRIFENTWTAAMFECFAQKMLKFPKCFLALFELVIVDEFITFLFVSDHLFCKPPIHSLEKSHVYRTFSFSQLQDLLSWSCLVQPAWSMSF